MVCLSQSYGYSCLHGMRQGIICILKRHFSLLTFQRGKIQFLQKVLKKGLVSEKTHENFSLFYETFPI